MRDVNAEVTVLKGKSNYTESTNTDLQPEECKLERLNDFRSRRCETCNYPKLCFEVPALFTSASKIRLCNILGSGSRPFRRF